jgi:dGTPase
MYKKLLLPERRKASSVMGRGIEEETASDRSRVIFSSPIRRLQQKAQVFSLETNASVRSRLTHSLEVADYGRLIAQKVTSRLIAEGVLEMELQIPFISIVETTCLLHDIGNPPFGHFGEAAIQDWFVKNWEFYYAISLDIDHSLIEPEINELMNDFREFDGNPQGFRIITILQQPSGPFTGTGLNLTLSQLYAFLKYLRVANNKPGDGILKKAGYFNSEEYIVKFIQEKLNHKKRFPLTYIMEAADDMSYCLSDIEDGIEKKIIDVRDFFENLKIEWKKITSTDLLPFGLSEIKGSLDEQFFLFKTKLARQLIEYATDIYIKDHGRIIIGEIGQLFDKNSEAHYILEALKNVSRKILFRSKEAENNELAGHAIIYGLLEKFAPLLFLPKEKFDLLIQSKEDPSVLNKKRLDIQLRLFNQLPKKYVDAYNFCIISHKFEIKNNLSIEWYFRAHLVVDFISGMTDLYALNLYRLLNGIEI